MSENVKHTPGPWEVGDGAGNGSIGRVYCNDATGSSVALVYGENGQQYSLIPLDQHRANARLIAAAPDLLAALQAYVRECKRQDIKLGPVTGDAEAAIAKATGATP